MTTPIEGQANRMFRDFERCIQELHNEGVEGLMHDASEHPNCTPETVVGFENAADAIRAAASRNERLDLWHDAIDEAIAGVEMQRNSRVSARVNLDQLPDAESRRVTSPEVSATHLDEKYRNCVRGEGDEPLAPPASFLPPLE